MDLTRIDFKDIHGKLRQHQAKGLHVDSRLWAEIEKPGEMYVGFLRSQDLLRLVWQSIDDARPLVPVGAPRMLSDCAQRLSKYGWQFQTLVDSSFKWFEKCVHIDVDFDYAKFGLIALTPLENSEMCETPQGTFYIYDGAHKTIVLAKKLLRNEIKVEGAEVLLLSPRRR